MHKLLKTPLNPNFSLFRRSSGWILRPIHQLRRVKLFPSHPSPLQPLLEEVVVVVVVVVVKSDIALSSFSCPPTFLSSASVCSLFQVIPVLDAPASPLSRLLDIFCILPHLLASVQDAP
ncbi:hypothetical protein F8388_008281 [Cannabis sativa]|uniref:Uncharacterized protein n=1 Tax=Cannabis sativa TaxID=3483 RepID=A0A7J6EPS7_CANSA|nr:hypothetical protein F8388_008281 [Cannabis sativa]